jgi:hypothetical protein
MKQKLLRYWLAANASALDAAIHSLVAFFGVAGISQVVPEVAALNLKQLAAVFGVSFIRALVNYLAAHPLSDLIPAETTAAVIVADPATSAEQPATTEVVQ